MMVPITDEERAFLRQLARGEEYPGIPNLQHAIMRMLATLEETEGKIKQLNTALDQEQVRADLAEAEIKRLKATPADQREELLAAPERSEENHNPWPAQHSFACRALLPHRLDNALQAAEVRTEATIKTMLQEILTTLAGSIIMPFDRELRDALAARIEVLELKEKEISEYKRILRKIGYPRRDLSEEDWDIQDAADLIQSLWTLGQLDGEAAP